MYYLDEVKTEIAKKINQDLDGEFVAVNDFVFPPDSALGDISLPLFALAKKTGHNPVELGQKLAGDWYSKNIQSAKSAGPYLNFFINQKNLAIEVAGDIQIKSDKYGRNDDGNQKKVMLEFSNGNTHKEVHIGHLRNICYGDSVSRILAANNFNVIPVSYINDFGIFTAKTLWYAFQYDNENTQMVINDSNLNKGYFLGQMYARACQVLEEKPEYKKNVAEAMKLIESREGGVYKLWQQTRQWSIEQLQKIYFELGIKFSRIFYESDEIDDGRLIVNELLEQGILKKSDGAVIFDLNAENLGVLVILRSDGTALYPVADLALAKKKFTEYGPDQSIYVVDIRQSQYFQQLFKLLAKAGYDYQLKHLAYDFVKLPSGMMASRSGNVITYDDLKKMIICKAAEETARRHPEWPESRISEVSAAIALGAMKFEMIKIGATNIITFDVNQALRFDGFTAAYLQYTHARINSLIRKSGIKQPDMQIDLSLLDHDKEKKLLLHLAKYPLSVKKAGDEYDPSEIAKYLFELAQNFNEFYQSVPILNSLENIKLARLALVESASQVLANGLDLLGISVMEEM